MLNPNATEWRCEALLEWRLEQRRQRDVGWTLLAQGSTPQANAPWRC